MVNEPVLFTPNVSDPDGDPISFLWHFIGPNPSTDTLGVSNDTMPEFTFEQIGKYTVRLIVSDGVLADTVENSFIVASPDIQLKEIKLGRDHACALTFSGKAYCWGQNDYGRLGNGQLTSSGSTSSPQLVVGDHTFKTIAPSLAHTCALLTTGEAYCWGYSYRNGHGVNIAVPRQVNGTDSLQFVSIGTGDYHSCALATTKVVYCWGSQVDGKLGNNRTGGETSRATAIADFVAEELAVGANHACARTEDGAVYCWGQNFGRVPTKIDGTAVFTQISAGRYGACGITVDADLYCWRETGGTPANNTPMLIGEGYVRVEVLGSEVYAQTPSGEWHVVKRGSSPQPVIESFVDQGGFRRGTIIPRPFVRFAPRTI